MVLLAATLRISIGFDIFLVAVLFLGPLLIEELFVRSTAIDVSLEISGILLASLRRCKK